MPRRSPTFGIFLAVLTAIIIGGVFILGALYVIDAFNIIRPREPDYVSPQPQPSPTAPPGKIQLQVQDIDTGAALGAASGSTKIDVVDPADMTRPKEVIEVDTTSKIATSGLLYQPGQRLLLHIYSSDGNGYYPAVYEVVVPSSYTMVGNQYVYFLGAFGLKQRVAASDVRFTLFLGATALSSATGSTPGSQGSATAPSKTFEMSVQINLNTYRVAFGRPVDYINARMERTVLRPVVWIAVNQTGISSSAFTNRGWQPVSTTAITGWLVFYKVLDPVESTQTALGSLSIPVYIDASSLPSGRKIQVYVWIADLQSESDARAGVGLGAPTPYGAFRGYGLATVLGTPFQSSGGAPTNPHLSAVITNA